MEERSFNYPDDKIPEPRRRPLWIIILTMIAVSVLFLLLIFNSPLGLVPDFFFGFPLDSTFLAILIFVPMLCLILIVGCGCDRPLTPEEKKEDAKIFESMRKRAAPAEHVADLNRYRCPECETSFELSYAEPVDENIVLCPICKTRLFIE